METRSRRTPRIAAPGDDRPSAAARAVPQPAAAPAEPPAPPQPALSQPESVAAPLYAAIEAPEPAAAIADGIAEAGPDLPPMPPSAQPAPTVASPPSAAIEAPEPAAAVADGITKAGPDLPPMPLSAQPAPPLAAEAAGDVFSAIAQSRAALAQGLESIGNEVASFARHSFDASAQAAIQLLEAKTWADAVAINTGFARTSFDNWLGSTAKVSELGIKLAIDWSKPLASEFGKVWSGAEAGR